MEVLRDIWNEEEGQGLVEYGLILALISIVVIAALTLVGGGLNTIFGEVKDELNSGR